MRRSLHLAYLFAIWVNIASKELNINYECVEKSSPMSFASLFVRSDAKFIWLFAQDSLIKCKIKAFKKIISALQWQQGLNYTFFVESSEINKLWSVAFNF